MDYHVLRTHWLVRGDATGSVFVHFRSIAPIRIQGKRHTQVWVAAGDNDSSVALKAPVPSLLSFVSFTYSFICEVFQYVG